MTATTPTTKKNINGITAVGLTAVISFWSMVCIVGTVKTWQCFNAGPTTCLIETTNA